MSAVEILLGATEPIGIRLRQGATLVTGATVRARVLRASDGWELDWSTNTFVAAGSAVQPRQTLTETPASSGLYEYAWDTGTITNPVTPDTYLVEFDQTAPTVRAFLRQSEVRVRASQSIYAVVSVLPSASATASSVWSTAVPGAFLSGSAGFVLGANLDAAVSSRAQPGDQMALVANAITAAKIDVAAIEADAFAADAISASAFSQGAADRVWTSAIRTLTAGAITSATFSTDAIDSNALATSAVAEIQSGLATAAGLALVQADTDDVQSRLPAALVGGRIDAFVGAMGADTLTAGAVANSAAVEIAGQVWEELAAAHVGAGSFGLLVGVNVDASVSSRATVSGVWSEPLPGAYGAGSAGSHLDAQVSSRATDAGASTAVWSAATRTLTSVVLDAGSLTAATIGAGYVAAVQAGLATSAQVSTVPGLVWDELLALHTAAGSAGLTLATLGSGSTPATIAAAVWATPEGAGTMGASLGLLRRRTTNRRKLDAGGTITFYDDADLPEKSALLTDVLGGPIVVVPGDPAESTAES